MTTTLLTAQGLLESGHPDFCALLRVWEIEKRAPLPLVDLLLELGMDRQAECARYAAEVEDRPLRCYRDSPVGGTYPCPWEGPFYWVNTYKLHSDDPAYCIPSAHIPHTNYALHNFKTFDGAVVWLLDNWKETL